MFGKDNGYTEEQMSAWFSIIKSVHEMAVGVYTIQDISYIITIREGNKSMK